MITDDLRDGMILRLTQDVQNPKPDRRAKYDWTKQPVLKKGMRFTVWGQTTTAYNHHWWLLKPATGGVSVYEHDPLFFHVLGDCEPVEESLEDLVAGQAGWAYEHIVTTLVASGRLTLDEVREMIK